ARLRILAGMDRAVGHHDGWVIVLEQRRQRADGWLVAGDHGDGAGEARSVQMLAQGVVGYLAPDQRVAHLAGAVADAVGYPDRVLRLHQSQAELSRLAADAAAELGMDRVDLRHDAEIALAVALGADDAHRGLVDQVRIRADGPGKPDGLG